MAPWFSSLGVFCNHTTTLLPVSCRDDSNSVMIKTTTVHSQLLPLHTFLEAIVLVNVKVLSMIGVGFSLSLFPDEP